MNGGVTRDWANGLCNDTGARVFFGSREVRRMYCDLFLGRDSILGSDGRCGPDDGPQCASCQKLQESQRLPTMRERFPSVEDEVVVAALRVTGGILSDATRHLVDLGASPQPDDRQTKELAKISRLPLAMARVALYENSCDISAATAWVSRSADGGGLSNLESCFRAAVRDKQTPDSKQVTHHTQDALKEFGRFSAWTKSLVGEVIQNEPIAKGGHWMIPCPKEVGRSINCVLCSCPVPSTLAGNFYCRACLLCEGCVESNVVHSCPSLCNGGHLHYHPLKFALERAICAHCDIEGEGCIGRNRGDRHKVTWSCPTCDFDICQGCIRRPAPDNFDRRVGGILSEESMRSSSSTTDITLQAPLPEQSGTDGQDNHSRKLLPHVAAIEKELVKLWEGCSKKTNDVMEIVVGNGRVGQTFEYTRHRSTSRAVPALSRNRPAISVLPDKAEDAIATYRKVAKSAADTTLVELMLQESQTIGSLQMREKVYQMVSSNEVQLAALLIGSQHFSPCAIEAWSSQSDETKTCWCGDSITLSSSFDGAVGCLHGHAMHSSCAADLLLGGDASCPFCREPVFVAPVAMSEAQAAAKMMAETNNGNATTVKIYCGDNDALMSGDACPRVLGKGDRVKICSDKSICAQVHADLSSGGWHEDMADICGSTALITDITSTVDRIVAVRVKLVKTGKHPRHKRRLRIGFQCRSCSRTFAPASCAACVYCSRCESCCDGDSESVGANVSSDEMQAQPVPTALQGSGVHHDWSIDPSLVTLVKKSENPQAGIAFVKGDKEAASVKMLAEQHMRRLRCELAAVKAAREQTKVDSAAVLGGKSATDASQLSAESLSVHQEIVGRGNLTMADCERARWLLQLADTWDHSELSVIEQVRADVRATNLESAARLVRMRNLEMTLEAVAWSDAFNRQREYTVNSAHLSLHSFPDTKAPQTGFVLHPRSDFCSEDEFIDVDGNTWLRVAPKAADFVDILSEHGHSASAYKKMIGCKVRRGPDWRHGDQDGGEGNEGIVVRGRPGLVLVRWKGIDTVFRYRALGGSRMEVEISSPSPPPQGWLCINAKGSGASLVAPKLSSLTCSCCDGALPTKQLKKNKSIYLMPEISDVSVGDCLLVAATLEEVQVKEVRGEEIHCLIRPNGYSEEAGSNSAVAMRTAPIWYRPDDLVRPAPVTEKDTTDDETRIVQGRARTRREVASLFPHNTNDAMAAWSAAKGGAVAEKSESLPFPSCLRGHLLHSRCFLGALLAGSKCPAPGCSESLWFPRVSRTDDDTAVSCGSNSDRIDDTEPISLDVSDSSGPGSNSEILDRSTDEEMSSMRSGGFRMCPACCSGPYENVNCSDMSAHHGQCTTIALGGRRAPGGGSGTPMCTPQGSFRASSKEISERLTRLGADGKSVADLLPRCPTHDVPVMFNGCTSCGHLFTDLGWRNLPAWDPDAKEKLALDKRKIAASRLLAAQIRSEAAMLQFERDALSGLRLRAESSSSK